MTKIHYTLPMKRKFRTIILFVCVVLTPLTTQAEKKPDPLRAFLSGLESLTADFTQTLIGTKGNVLEEAAGVLQMQNPGQFYWSYTTPYVQSIITDGSTLWIYDEDLEQVTIRNVSGSLEDTPAAVLSGTENLEAHYQVIDQGVIEGLKMFQLNPLNAENQFQRIHIGFHGRFLFTMVMYDNLGQVTRVNFKNPKRNADVDPSIFKFTVPDGVDVIDDRQGNVNE